MEHDKKTFDQELHDSFKWWCTAERGRKLLTEEYPKKYASTDILVWCGDNITYVYPKFMFRWPTIRCFPSFPKDRYEDAPLHYAIDQKGFSRAIRKVAEYICNCTGQHSPLHFAGNRDQIEIIKLLLYHNAPFTHPLYGHTPFHELAWNQPDFLFHDVESWEDKKTQRFNEKELWEAKLQLANAFLCSPQGSPGCSATRQKEASDRIFTVLCCFKRLKTQLTLPYPIPKDIAYYILLFLPDDLHKAPLGAYWRRHSPEQLINKASFGLHLLLTATHKIGKATMEPIFEKEKVIEALTTRHIHNMQTTLQLTSTYHSHSKALTPSQLVEYRYRNRPIAQNLAELLNPKKVEILAPKIKEEYTKLFNQHKAHNE